MGIAILNSKLRSHKNSTNMSKPEKRLFLITVIEIVGATAFVVISYFDQFVLHGKQLNSHFLFLDYYQRKLGSQFLSILNCFFISII